MYEGRRVGVVVPVYNEERFVGRVIETVPPFVDRLYVVDDASTDGTWSEINDHTVETWEDVDPQSVPLADGGEAGFRVVAIRHGHNQGRGGAVKTGYQATLEHDVDVVAVMDGDGQMDPSILHEIVDPVVRGEADYVVGNRLGQPGTWREMPPFRLFGNLLLTGITRIASGFWSLSDPQNGYTAISRRALEALNLDALYDEYGFLNDVLVRLNVHGFEVVNVPMHARYGEESSGIRYSSFVPKLSALLGWLFIWRLTTKLTSDQGVDPPETYRILSKRIEDGPVDGSLDHHGDSRQAEGVEEA